MVPESLYGIPPQILTLWLLALTGWLAVLADLARAPAGFARRTALLAHVMTPPGVVLACAMLGYGSVHGAVAVTAEYWSLVLVTGFRPRLLLAYGTLPRLAAWSALTVALLLAGTRWVLTGRP